MDTRREEVKHQILIRAERLCRLLDLDAPLNVLNNEVRLLSNAGHAALGYAMTKEREDREEPNAHSAGTG